MYITLNQKKERRIKVLEKNESKSLQRMSSNFKYINQKNNKYKNIKGDENTKMENCSIVFRRKNVEKRMNKGYLVFVESDP